MFKKTIVIFFIVFSVCFVSVDFVSAAQNPMDLIKEKLLNIGNNNRQVSVTGTVRGAVDLGKMMMNNAEVIKNTQQTAEQAKKFLTAGSGKMTPEIWVEITARLRCVNEAVVDKEQTNAIMSQFGVTSAEYAAYAWQTNFKTSGDEAMQADWNIEEMNKRYEDKYNELVVSGNCAVADAIIDGMNDDKWIEMTGLFMCLNNTEDVKHGWIFSQFRTTINEFDEYDKKIKLRDDYSEMKEKTRARYWTFVGNRICDRLNQSVADVSTTLPYVPYLMDNQNLWDYIKLRFKNFGCKIGLISGGVNCPTPAVINHPVAAEEDMAVKTDSVKQESLLEKIKCQIKKFFGKECT
ncbi:MAG: hypothetical protein COU29_01010 [Candidatus Magasanikbacteria bacterium CG10_big_fil_rev_8_21_14_0_10_36_32]|uniref:Uncharacterized protein n=1 Tax=Candidatus Magasanikbacteria bacterium CG10_big_fil_rev_8_21_14_0_10_36_32 TaxID=1974646 RepID=A0A2M6W6E9_9BACT|nr:MAG: hypothetical protein COU29_01010 [Candidatus Magasanikbacteria bacterium CG10_big_fil_rev_8_21_14_0_10_36_32]